MPDVFQLTGHRFKYIYKTGAEYVIFFKDEHTLHWEAVAGPDKGRSAIEIYDSIQIEPNVHFISWLEADGTVVSQVVDYKQMHVYTSLAIDGNRVFLEGKLRQ